MGGHYFYAVVIVGWMDDWVGDWKGGWVATTSTMLL